MNYDSFIFIGHGTSEKTGKYDPGATNGNLKEYEIAKSIVNAAKSYLNKTGLNIHYDENNYSDLDLQGNSYNYRCGITIHINAGGGNGCEIYVPSKEKTLDSDFVLLQQTSKLLSIPNRGVKSRDYNTEKTVLRTNGKIINQTDYYKEIREAWNLGVSLSIFEVGFIDTSDINKILERINELGYLVATYICNNCNITLIKPPEIKPEDNNTFYRVVTGSYNNKSNAEIRVKELKDKGFDSFIDIYKK